MDLDAYVAAHSREWARLEELLGRASRPRRLEGGEVDELVDLYQRTATHLSVVQSAGRDARASNSSSRVHSRLCTATYASRSTRAD